MPKSKKETSGFMFNGKRYTNLPKAKEAQKKHEQKTGEYVSITVLTPFGESTVFSGEEWKWDANNYRHQIPREYR